MACAHGFDKPEHCTTCIVEQARRIGFPLRVEQRGRCLIWLGAKEVRGYGYVNWWGAHIKVHRIAFTIEHGYWAERVLHDCGNHACLSVRCLYDGDQVDNAEDARRHGTLLMGERSPSAKLSDADVVLLRQSWLAGQSCADLGRAFNIHPSHASRLARGICRP